MFLSNLSIKRPVFAAVMMLALVTLGVFSYRRLAIDLFPDVEIPVLSILTKYPGASPETVEREVSKRIEEAVNPIPGVKHVTSTSRESLSTVVVEFNLEVKINEAAQDARAKINAIRDELPQLIEDPVIQKLDFGAYPILSLAVRSQTKSARELTSLVEKKIQRRLENISGVGKIDLVGKAKREVNVNLNLDRMEALGLGVNEIALGLQSENVNTPIGRLTRDGREYTLRVSGKPDWVEQFDTMVVTRRGDRPIQLNEVATVVDGVEEQRSLALVDGTPAVALNVLKQSGANTVGVVEAVKKEVKKLQSELPPGVDIEIVRDSSVWIRDSVTDVENTLLLGGLLTVFIVFLFLNSWRSTVITGLTLPISVISAFIIMNFGGMTLNTMTLMALSLAIGLLIDDAIVVRENIVRHLELGQDHFTAAREGTAEIGLAVLATTFSIVAVFVPVAFMKGIIGRFFFHFGITVTFAVLVSLFVSFTLDPMLSSRWFDPDIERRGKRHFIARLLDRFNHLFDLMANGYRRLIGWSLNHRFLVIAIAALFFVGGLGTLGLLEQDFMPVADQGEFQITFKASPDASFVESRGRVQEVLAELKQIPEVEHTFATVAASEMETVRDAGVYVRLVEKNKRKRGQEEVQREVRQRLAHVPGINISILEAGAMDNRKKLLVGVRGEDLQRLKYYAAQLKENMYKIPGVVDLEMSLEQDVPEYRLFIDRQRSTDAGLMTMDIVRSLGVMVGGQAVTTYEDQDGDAVNVRLRLPEELRKDPAQVERLRLAVLGRDGQPALIPISNVAKYQMSTTPSEINRQDLSREVVISANIDGIALETAKRKIMGLVSRMKLDPGYRVVMTGETEIMEESFGFLAESLLLAVIFVYLILAAQFESFVDPLAIMLSLPLSVVGMAGLLLLTGDKINIMAYIGLIMLMGLVTKNAILLVDYSKVLQRRGMKRREAVITAGRTRLRPIMMTTLAMIFGMLPLALGIGEGAEFRSPMARAVVGGLITSTFLTLLVVPVVYTILDDFGSWIKRRWASEPEVKEAEQEVMANELTP